MSLVIIPAIIVNIPTIIHTTVIPIRNILSLIVHNGELIGWEVYETKAVLYPRVLMSLPEFTLWHSVTLSAFN